MIQKDVLDREGLNTGHSAAHRGGHHQPTGLNPATDVSAQSDDPVLLTTPPYQGLLTDLTDREMLRRHPANDNRADFGSWQTMVSLVDDLTSPS